MYQKIKKKKKLEGILCKSTDGSFFLRVYDKSNNFKDYEIAHCDLKITIEDDDCFLYEDDYKKEYVIDYGPKTLGIKND